MRWYRSKKSKRNIISSNWNIRGKNLKNFSLGSIKFLKEEAIYTHVCLDMELLQRPMTTKVFFLAFPTWLFMEILYRKPLELIENQLNFSLAYSHYGTIARSSCIVKSLLPYKNTRISIHTFSCAEAHTKFYHETLTMCMRKCHKKFIKRPYNKRRRGIMCKW